METMRDRDLEGLLRLNRIINDKDRQIADLEERLAAWREWHGMLRLVEYDWDKAGNYPMKRLKDLGEIK